MSDTGDRSGGPLPPSPPAPARRELNRAPVIVAAGLLLTAAAIGVIVARFGDDDGDAASPSPGTDAPPAVSEQDRGTTATSGSNGTTTTTAGTEPIEGLAVVDSGFSTYEGFDGPAGSYGLILENRSDRPINHLAVQVVVYDTNDTVVGSYDHTVAVVSPGARLGLGAEISDPLPNGIGRIDIRTEGREGEPVPSGTFSVADVSTSSDEFGVYTTFVVSSSYAVEFELTPAYAVYRDAAGRIVGGASGLIDLIPPGGRANGEVTAFAVVPNVARAEVYVDPGFL